MIGNQSKILVKPVNQSVVGSCDNKSSDNFIKEIFKRCEGDFHLVAMKVAESMYTLSKEESEERAILCYLLNYQHYNAEFTDSENERLGYPKPFNNQLENSGYFRTDHAGMIRLISPWAKENLTSFFNQLGCSLSEEYVCITTKAVIRVLHTFFSEIIELHDAKPKLQINKSEKNQVVIIRVEPKELIKGPEDLLKERMKEFKDWNNCCFLFLVEDPNIDCTMMFHARYKNGELKGVLLGDLLKDLPTEKLLPKWKKNLIEGNRKSFLSILNKTGAVPDRLAIHELMTLQPVKTTPMKTAPLKKLLSKEILNKIGLEVLIHKDDVHLELGEFVKAWKSCIKAIRKDNFEDDPGCSFYRDAIICWHDKFFDQCNRIESAAPLLSTQVLPWMTKTSEIKDWAKAYQNICEVVLFCIQSQPEKFSGISFKSTVLQTLGLGKKWLGVYQSAGLFPYAMSSTFSILNYLVGNKKKSIVCISQTYFETLELLEKMNAKQLIALNLQNTLNQVKEIPDILIADIHPNNAAQKILIQNDVAEWIDTKLTNDSSKKLTLILDITLNNLSDPVIQNTLKILKSYIEKGSLELFILQSLAKLMQLGPDNFSGGLCIHMRKDTPKQPLKFPVTPPHKSAFFALLIQHFQPAAKNYFQLIRQNNYEMYQVLDNSFKEIQKKVGFCVLETTLNTDEGSPYVAISFNPLRKKIGKEDGKYIGVADFQKSLLKMAETLNLPLTGRQSFGFPLSNMSTALDAIRLSVGLENDDLLLRYVELISIFAEALSSDVAKSLKKFNPESFNKNIQAAFTNLYLPNYSLIKNLPVDESEFTEKIEKRVEICFTDGRMRLVFSDPKKGLDEDLIVVDEKDVRLLISTDIPSSQPWSLSDSIRLIFNVHYLNLKLHIISLPSTEKQTYAIGGVIEQWYRFSEDSRTSDKASGIEIIFGPEFKLILPPSGDQEREYGIDDVFVQLEEEYGTHSVKLGSLRRESLHGVFTKCARFHLEAVKDDKKDGIFLKFLERKKYSDYSNIWTLIKGGKMKPLINFLNGLDINDLPLSNDHSWNTNTSSWDKLSQGLQNVGFYLVYRFNKDIWKAFKYINESRFKDAILYGMIRGLFIGSSNKWDDKQYSFIKDKLNQKLSKSLKALFEEFFFTLFNENSFNLVQEIDEWVTNLRSSDNNFQNKKLLSRYVHALLPVIKAVYRESRSLLDTDYSVPLKYLGETLNKCGISCLDDHLQGLEDKLISLSVNVKSAGDISCLDEDLQKLEDDLKARSVNVKSVGDISCLDERLQKLEDDLISPSVNVKSVGDLTRCMKLYCRYPLQQNKQNVLIENFKEVPQDILKKWIESYYLCLRSLDSDDDEAIFNVNDQNKIQSFFNKMGKEEFFKETIDNFKKKIDDFKKKIVNCKEMIDNFKEMIDESEVNFYEIKE